MSQFYENVLKMEAEKANRQANFANGTSNFTKIGYFGRMKDANGNYVKFMTKSGDSALVRINMGKNIDSKDPNCEFNKYGAFVHPAAEGVRVNGRPYQKVKCLEDNCPICNGLAAGQAVGFGKATTRLYIPMVIAYKLPDGSYTNAEPVVMDAPSYMIEHIKQTIGDFVAPTESGLRDHVFKLTRTGSGTDTRYSLSLLPLFDNENIITKASLDAFNNFDVTKHSYWVKTANDINTFLATGAFPEAAKEEATTTPQSTAFTATPVQPVFTAPAQPAVNVAPTPAPNAFAAAEANPFAAPTQPAQPATATPTRNTNFQQNW